MATAQAGSPYEGVYTGTFSTGGGAFAFFIGTDATAAVLGYNTNASSRQFYDASFQAGTGGNFSFTVVGPGSMSGTLSSSKLFGSFSGRSGSGTISGSKEIPAGIQQDSIGYYEGSIQGTGDSGSIKAILAPDGTFVLLLNFSSSGQDAASGSATNSGGDFAVSSLKGVAIEGNFNSLSHVLSGGWSTGTKAGQFVANRTRYLPDCYYSLSHTAIMADGSGYYDSVEVNAPNGCSWTANPNQTWITIVGMDPTGFDFLVDANPDSFRTGTISVGDQIFTITQGPTGYVWNDVFGWLYGAEPWYYHNGFGWMWFGDTYAASTWIWSSSLQGWVATMDNARTLWSPQYRWLTLSDNDFYRLNSSALGWIYVGQYLGSPIPQGWVASERFGYLWPAGDGVWFYSSTYQWLGVTANGGIWCVSQNRWL